MTILNMYNLKYFAAKALKYADDIIWNDKDEAGKIAEEILVTQFKTARIKIEEERFRKQIRQIICNFNDGSENMYEVIKNHTPVRGGITFLNDKKNEPLLIQE